MCQLKCLQVIASLVADQLNSVGGCPLGWSLHLRLCTPAVGATADC